MDIHGNSVPADLKNRITIITRGASPQVAAASSREQGRPSSIATGGFTLRERQQVFTISAGVALSHRRISSSDTGQPYEAPAVSRRSFLGAAALAIGATALTACSSNTATGQQEETCARVGADATADERLAPRP
ncbi:MAG: twin-arginine translocation signal domain-containing protein, partial [Chloroflexi bacterium]|nr:twin-arginine translocation signal domain-containing protein [Chloroflexota bacterium]